MTHKESLLSSTTFFNYSIMSMWPCISLQMKSYWRCSLRTSSIQCHSDPVLVPPLKPAYNVKYFYDGQTYELKTRVYMWTIMDVVPVQYGTFSQTFHLTMWFFQFNTWITFKWDYVMWCIISLLVWIGLWAKLRIYIVPPDPVRWSCGGFEYLWQALMLIWVLWTKNDLKVYHSKQLIAPSNMKLATSLMDFECHPCEIFEGFSYHQ